MAGRVVTTWQRCSPRPRTVRHNAGQRSAVGCSASTRRPASRPACNLTEGALFRQPPQTNGARILLRLPNHPLRPPTPPSLPPPAAPPHPPVMPHHAPVPPGARRSKHANVVVNHNSVALPDAQRVCCGRKARWLWQHAQEAGCSRGVCDGVQVEKAGAGDAPRLEVGSASPCGGEGRSGRGGGGMGMGAGAGAVGWSPGGMSAAYRDRVQPR